MVILTVLIPFFSHLNQAKFSLCPRMWRKHVAYINLFFIATNFIMRTAVVCSILRNGRYLNRIFINLPILGP